MDTLQIVCKRPQLLNNDSFLQGGEFPILRNWRRFWPCILFVLKEHENMQVVLKIQEPGYESVNRKCPLIASQPPDQRGNWQERPDTSVSHFPTCKLCRNQNIKPPSRALMNEHQKNTWWLSPMQATTKQTPSQQSSIWWYPKPPPPSQASTFSRHKTNQ